MSILWKPSEEGLTLREDSLRDFNKASGSRLVWGIDIHPIYPALLAL